MKILITGGTGSLGSALVKKWYNEGHTLTVTSNELHQLAKMEKQFPVFSKRKFPNIIFKIADICDYDQMAYLCKGQDLLIHAAALKHVGLGERNIDEYIRVNINGTLTIARAWANTHGEPSPVDALRPQSPRRAILISSDKAVAPLNHYGGTKFMAEKLFLNQFGYTVLRYGNVCDSQGSFWHIWNNEIANFKPITVRLPEPTRFFLKLSDGIKLVEDTIIQQSNGLFVPYAFSSISIAEVADKMSKSIIRTDLGLGEKQHEILLAEDEFAVRVSDNLGKVVNRGYKDEILDRRLFSSETADRISASAFIKKMK